MEWLTEDPELFRFLRDAIDRWDDQDAAAQRTDSVTSAQPPKRVELSSRSEPSPKKAVPSLHQRVRRKRKMHRDEILLLREKVTSLQYSLATLKLDQRPGALAARGDTPWKLRARQELTARRIAEELNARMRAMFARHSQIKQQLLQLVVKPSPVSIEINSIGRQSLAPLSPFRAMRHSSGPGELASVPSFTTHTHNSQCVDSVVVLGIHATWRLPSGTMDVEAAIWALLHSEEVIQLPPFSIHNTVLDADETSMRSTHSISSGNGVHLTGHQAVRSSRDKTTGELLVALVARTVPHEIDPQVVAHATLLVEETSFRVSADGGAMPHTVVQIRRQFRLFAERASARQRRGLSDMVATHLQEEMRWMQRRIERTLSMDTSLTEKVLVKNQEQRQTKP